LTQVLLYNKLNTAHRLLWQRPDQVPPVPE